jgi:hypothetical protein
MRLSIAVLVLPILFYATDGLAAPVPLQPARNYNTIRETHTTNDIKAVKSVLNGGWDSLQVPTLAASGQKGATIQKNMWALVSEANTNSSLCYIEVLDQNGNWDASIVNQFRAAGFGHVTSPSYKGYVISTTSTESATPSLDYGKEVIKSYPYGGNGTGTAQTGGTLKLINAGVPGTWQVRINNTIALERNLSCTKKVNGANVIYTVGAAMTGKWGIEANDTLSTYTNNTSMNVQSRTGSGVYVNPQTVTDNPYENVAGWTYTYDKTTGKLTFKRP